MKRKTHDTKSLTALKCFIAEASIANSTVLNMLNSNFQDQAKALGLPKELNILTTNAQEFANKVIKAINEVNDDFLNQPKILQEPQNNFAFEDSSVAYLLMMIGKDNLVSPGQLAILNYNFQNQAKALGLPEELNILTADAQEFAESILLGMLKFEAE